ncbi:MAG: penicillin-binding protein 2 [Lachnospiraceae bacterium]|nr:penicillin-binding protein 2 [Lachnospiraceae bacterium]
MHEGFERTVTERRERLLPIRLVSVFFVCLFAALLTYVTWYALSHKEELLNNGYNGQQTALAAKNVRGTIYSAHNDVLAQTLTDEAGNERRNYPYENLFAHVVGYSTHGKYGVELSANYYLLNSTSSLATRAALFEAGKKSFADDVYTTLDVDLQEVCYKALGAFKGAIVVTDPNTGAVLAMVSKPDFDPNTVDRDWAQLTQDDGSSELVNRATLGLYPPGSTFKIVTALEYLRENPDSYQNYGFTCNGHFDADGERINCYHGQTHGKVDFTSSFSKSCNSSFANMGTTLYDDAFSKTLNDLLFFNDLPLNVPYNKSSAYCDDTTPTGEMMQLSIGQGETLMSPVHLNLITQAIANDGVLMTPYVIREVVNAEGKVVTRHAPKEYRRLMREEEALVLQGLMEEVVENGTGRRLKEASYSAAGKTGSAEFNTGTDDSHAWFTGYAPATDPEVCVTIIIENAGSGGEYAVPIAKRIFDAYFGI